MPALEIDSLHVHYGGVHALRGLSLTVEEGEIVALLGNNGAGKTTTLSAVSGLVRPSAGRIVFQGRDVTRARPEEIVKAGLVHVPEGRRVFSTLTVHENLQLGGYLVRDHAELRWRIDRVYTLLPRLAERRDQQAGTLSGGEQQMLAIARGLMSNPKLILLDEPSLGLAPIIVNQVYELIAQIREQGITVLLVEQNALKALNICDRAYVLENGRIALSGTGCELLNSDKVKKAYLGG